MSERTPVDAASEMLARLVACSSMNPGGRLPPPGYGETALARLLDGLLSSWGARTRIEELGPGRCNFIATWAGRRTDRALLLDAHADTVGANGMTIPPFEPQVRNGRLYGRGSCDTKGGMAAMLLAIRKVLDEYGQPPITLHFVATGDEEDGGLGATRLAAAGLKVDGAIVAEPTDLRIVYAHKGACRFRIALLGKAAHSSVPELGINAVEASADLMQAIRRQFISRLMNRVHPALGKAITCVTVIEGGERVNIVPDRCQIEVDCRCLPGERRQHLEKVMRGILDEQAASLPGLRYECEIFQWYPALAGNPSDAFTSRMAAAAQGALGSDFLVTAPYGTNAGFFNEVGIPCIVFGPGSIAQAHTADEFVEIEQVAWAVPVYARMILSME